jgi:hypothetical protein
LKQGEKMKFPGYWASMSSGKALLERTTFDETDLDPATNWKQAWQNEDETSTCNGFVELRDALIFVAKLLSTAEERTLSNEEIAKIVLIEPQWIKDSFQISTISQLLTDE